jgi:hypothetical protein
MHGRELNPNFSFGGWNSVPLEAGQPSVDFAPAFTWCRAEFALPKTDPAWSIPWKLVFGGERDALLYLNGKFVGRFVTAGPQTDFYLPEPYLHMDGAPNVMTVVLAYAESPASIKSLRVEPYTGYATRRTRVELAW